MFQSREVSLLFEVQDLGEIIAWKLGGLVLKLDITT